MKTRKRPAITTELTPTGLQTNPLLPPTTTTAKDPPPVAVDSESERDKQGYYRDKKLDGDLWDKLVDKYERYRSEEM